MFSRFIGFSCYLSVCLSNCFQFEIESNVKETGSNWQKKVNRACNPSACVTATDNVTLAEV